MNWFVVAFGGALGSIARYAVSSAARVWWPGFPWGTLIVNIVGGLVMGTVAALAMARPGFPEPLRLGLTTGVLGGFTTFSAFSLDTMLLWRDASAGAALWNVIANVGLSLGACALGLWLGRQFA